MPGPAKVPCSLPAAKGMEPQRRTTRDPAPVPPLTNPVYHLLLLMSSFLGVKLPMSTRAIHQGVAIAQPPRIRGVEAFPLTADENEALVCCVHGGRAVARTWAAPSNLDRCPAIWVSDVRSGFSRRMQTLCYNRSEVGTIPARERRDHAESTPRGGTWYRRDTHIEL